MNKQKFWVLNTIMAFVLVGLGLAGFLTDSFMGAGKYGSVGVTLMMLVALASHYRGNHARAEWFTDKLTAFGLVGTLIGVAQAFAHAQYGGSDPLTALASIGTGVGLAVLSTLSGVAAWLWTGFVLQETQENVAWDVTRYSK